MKNKMKAIVVKAPGGPEQLQLQEFPVPEYGPDDVLVQMKVVGINYLEVYIRTGLYKPSHYPYVPGKEGSGIVAAVGKNVKDIKVGDRVAFCGATSGTYAEYTVVPAIQAVKIPDSVSFELAGASMLQGLTAYYLSHLTFPLNKTHTAIVQAGAGGVGLLLIQMAKIIGAKVITTVSTEDKARYAKKAGADLIVLYTKESFLDAAKKFTQNKGVNVVYDGVGKTTFDDSLESLAIRGMLVSFGQSSGAIPPFEPRRLSEKSLYFTRPVLFQYTATKEEIAPMSSALFDLIEKGKLHITIGQRYRLEDAAKAHIDLEARKTIGKSILIVGEGN